MLEQFAWLLLELQIALAVGVGIVLLLRRPVQERFGATAKYRLWLAVPVLMIGVLIPARTVVATISDFDEKTFPPVISEQEVTLIEPGIVPSADVSAPFASADIFTENNAVNYEAVASVPAPISAVSAEIAPAGQITQRAALTSINPVLALLLLWGLGLAISASLLFIRQRRFESSLGTLDSLRSSENGVLKTERDDVGPALVGFRNPKIIVPSDFDKCYTEEEQSLIIAHERVHFRRGDAQANGLAAALCCFSWFNPLTHFAISKFRLDQELACDAAVIRQHPSKRRVYGEAMLKSQLRGTSAPLACHWLKDHPLKERIAMLSHPSPNRAQRLLGTLLVSGAVAGAGTLAWASQPPTVLTQDEEIVDIAPLEGMDDDQADAVEFEPLLGDGGMLFNEQMDIKGLELDNTMGTLKVIPERRSDYLIQITGKNAPTMRKKNGELIIDGGLPKHNRKCGKVTAKNVANEDDALFITVRAPMDADITAEGILFSKVGVTKGADLTFSGCGTADVGDSLGPLDISFHGVAKGTFGNVDGPLDVSVHGSSKAKGGRIDGSLDMSVHGSSNLMLGDVNGAVDASVHGSSNAEIGDIDGALDASVHGSSNLRLGRVSSATDASVHGSSTLDMAKQSGPLDLSIHGAGRLNIDETIANQVDISANGASSVWLGKGKIGTLDVDVGGASNAKFKGFAENVFVDNGGASNVYVESAGRVKLDHSKPKGRVQLRTKDKEYR